MKTYFIFPPQLTNAYALPGETARTPEIESFHLNIAFTKTQNIVKISPGQS